jgi:hypothetical protein
MTKQPDFSAAARQCEEANRTIRAAWWEIVKAVRTAEQEINETWRKAWKKGTHA